MKHDVLIVGAGLAGLCAARYLSQHGVQCLLLEAGNGVGGRIRTDLVDGFRLDRGFQVFLTSYPEAQQVLNYQALQLHAFLPGALVRHGGHFHALTDPWRRPGAALGSVLSPVGSLADKVRTARLRWEALQGSLDDVWRKPEKTTLARLQSAGFSPSMIDRFFRPFLGGIFLEAELQTSSRMFDFVFRMFALGNACLPAEGMETIPRQLAAGWPAGMIRFGARVESVQSGVVKLDSGEELKASAVVVAADGPTAGRLLGDATVNTREQGVTCLYYAAPQPPNKEPVLLLNGDGRGPINNVCVPTVVAPSYGPRGQHLVSVTVLGVPEDQERLQNDVQTQLTDWFGRGVTEWRHLRTYRIPYALPRQAPPALESAERQVRSQPGVYVCGDHRDSASIQGAMVSGRRAAQALLEDQAG